MSKGCLKKCSLPMQYISCRSSGFRCLIPRRERYFWVRRISNHTSVSVSCYHKQMHILINNPKHLNFKQRPWISILRTLFSGFMLNIHPSRTEYLSSSTGSTLSSRNLHVCAIILSQNQNLTLGLWHLSKTAVKYTKSLRVFCKSTFEV